MFSRMVGEYGPCFCNRLQIKFDSIRVNFQGNYSPTVPQEHSFYFMLSGMISRNIDENIFRSYAGTTGENTDFHVLVAYVNCVCLTTRWKYDVIYLTFLAPDVML